MSDLNQFNELIGQWAFLSVPVGLFVASVIGSSHCVSMCGPIAITVNNNSGYLTFYHFGRLLSYLTLGAIAGYFGEKLLLSEYRIVSITSAILISIFLIFSGYRLIRQKSLELFFSKKLTSLLFVPVKWAGTQNPTIKSLTIGVVNGFLPCGWLYVFVLGSIATKDTLYGAILLAIFWLGTVPALTVFAVFYKTLFNKFPSRLNRIAGIILVAVGLANVALLVFKVVPTVRSIHHGL